MDLRQKVSQKPANIGKFLANVNKLDRGWMGSHDKRPTLDELLKRGEALRYDPDKHYEPEPCDLCARDVNKVPGTPEWYCDCEYNDRGHGL